jgi:signal peptidase I
MRFNKPLSAWIHFAAWSLLLILFLAWVGNFWWLLLLPLIFDMYITRFIPWGWWKSKKESNPAYYKFWSWVDAIVWCLIAVGLINNYIFQNYRIPSSSLEKTLLTGDFLLVSKVAYGPRNPMTPLSFPLVQHTLPVLNCKSYIEHPQLKYKRLKGFGKVQRNDIVVFNFPTGDTVCTKMQDPDYYTLCHIYGRERVWNDKATFGDIVYRPVDRRENYVKRCVALPGDTLQIVNNDVYVNGAKQSGIEGLQLNYFIQTNGAHFNENILSEMGIALADVMLLNAQFADMTRLLDTLRFEQNNSFPLYRIPLTQSNYEKMKQMPAVLNITPEPAFFAGETFPLGNSAWTRDNYGPLWIPAKGATVNINNENIALYELIIRNYEGNKLDITENGIFINGEKADTYTFKMDYYWMMGDNRHNSADSRFWGFVPEDHIVGRPVFVWLSLDQEKSLFGGKIRFNRFFKNAMR